MLTRYPISNTGRIHDLDWIDAWLLMLRSKIGTISTRMRQRSHLVSSCFTATPSAAYEAFIQADSHGYGQMDDRVHDHGYVSYKRPLGSAVNAA